MGVVDLVLGFHQESSPLQRSDGLRGLILGVEYYLDWISIGGWSLWGEGVDVDPLAGGVQQLNVAPPAQERVQHAHQLRP